MSAYVVSKTHIDLLVKAADMYGRVNARCQGTQFQWWQTDENGDYAGWYGMVPDAEYRATIDGYMEFLTPSQAGQILVDENVRSVSHRYPDDDVDVGELPGPCDAYYIGPYVYADPGYTLTPAEVFRAIDCLDYQSCEHDGWRKSSAFAFLEALRQVACSAVDGYEDAPWEFDGDFLRERMHSRKVA